MPTFTSPVPNELLVAEQFDDIEQQRDAAKLGMWIFLATEVLFFGGLFLSYTIYRFNYSETFAAASRHTGSDSWRREYRHTPFQQHNHGAGGARGGATGNAVRSSGFFATALLGIVFMVVKASSITKILSIISCPA